ncbi:MAG TPA: Mrp/NBP35 family ATP-binding protein [Alphaproteobacteria bacterium]|nr:Mrp/NBP35 family ATP-binding protein [Micavibrio sp.]HQX28117.1 Mrp/NBP35 family ATP-binding protein [Alphaproteobacteria bacterium]
MKPAVLQPKELQREIMEALGRVNDPGRGRDIVSLGMISGLQVTADGNVIFMIEVDPARGAKLEPLRQEAEHAAAAVPGVRKVTAVLTAQKASNDPHGMEKNPKLELPIKNIIAVASGKGGVGKSTVAMNLAIALGKSGKSVGLLDADIYGPSVPKMSGLEGQRPKQNDDGKLIPLEAHGLKIMSIGFMLDKEAPLVWRGPMVQTAVYQMLRDVEWGTEENKLDILIVDMPPGTGDAQLTLAQKVPVTGAVIVSTPQDIALIDARKAVAMFQKVNVKILGIIENMSAHICSNCGHEEHIFGHGGAKREASRLGVPFLGEIPLDAAIRKNSDEGKSAAQDIFSKISQAVIPA